MAHTLITLQKGDYHTPYGLTFDKYALRQLSCFIGSIAGLWLSALACPSKLAKSLSSLISAGRAYTAGLIPQGYRFKQTLITLFPYSVYLSLWIIKGFRRWFQNPIRQKAWLLYQYNPWYFLILSIGGILINKDYTVAFKIHTCQNLSYKDRQYYTFFNLFSFISLLTATTYINTIKIFIFFPCISFLIWYSLSSNKLII